MEEINKQQQSYVQLEMLNQQLEELEQSLYLADEHIIQLESAKEAISALEKGGNDVLIPISAGIFLPVKKVDLDKIKVSTGMNIVVEKNSKDTIAIIDKHLKNITNHKMKTIELFDEVSLQAIKLQQKIEKNH